MGMVLIAFIESTRTLMAVSQRTGGIGIKQMAQKGKKRYKAIEICRLFDISKATLFRWERDGRISNVRRDWRNWRLYTNENIQKIRTLIGKKNMRRD